MLCQQVTGENICLQGVHHRHVIVGILAGVAVGDHIVGFVRIDILPDAFPIGGGSDEISVVVRFQEFCDQVQALGLTLKEVAGPFRSIYMEGPPNRGSNSADYITQVAVPIK